MVNDQAQSLRKAIENLINAKLHDALARPGGLDRTHRASDHRCCLLGDPQRGKMLDKAVAEKSWKSGRRGLRSK